MNRKALVEQIFTKKSFLCVGLDTDIAKIPAHLHQHDNSILEFNRQIIEATAPYAVSYKINTAFYEAMSEQGWQNLLETIALIPKDTFIIADAKRGDIGNTSTQYAEAFLDKLGCDAVTVAPYMGKDSVAPFLAFENKWAILLALTSNEGAQDFELLELANGKKLYEQVLETSQAWGTTDNLMYVVGATKTDYLQRIRQLIPNHFLLVPGVGAQGGSLEEVARIGKTKDIGLLINSSRQIIYASSGEDFAQRAAQEAKKIQEEMAKFI